MSDDDCGEGSIDFREVPAGCQLDEFHFSAWSSCMSWLFEKEEVREEFQKETGTTPLRLPRNGLERMIDEACGVDNLSYVAAFCRWATPNYWGDERQISPAIAAKLAS